MVVKVYISGISGNKEVKKRQQRVLMILDSKSIKYEVIDITEPGKEVDKEFMQNNAKSNGGTVSDPNPRSPLPPQVFNDDIYCGDYDQFDLANEVDTLEQFLKIEVPPEEPPTAEKDQTLNGEIKEDKASKENSQERDKICNEKDSMPLNEATPAKEGTPAKESTPIKESTSAKESTPSKEGTPKEGTPAKENTPVKEGTPAKESTPVKEGTPAKEKNISKEGTPMKEGSPTKETKERVSKEASPKIDTPLKELSPEKVLKPEERQISSVEKESEIFEKDVTENLKKFINENGTSSSREQSQEKGDTNDVDLKKDNPSEVLIKNEQEAANI